MPKPRPKQKSYDDQLDSSFFGLEINLVKHDTSPTGLPCYIEAHLGAKPKDPGLLVLDLGNYIYRRLGLKYQMCPEFRGKGKATTLRWFMSWQNVEPIQANICAAFDSKVLSKDWLPVEFRSLIVQNIKKGVHPSFADEKGRAAS